jgi:hypothetical protein
LSSFPLIVYRAVAVSDSATDAERVRILNWLILAAVLVIGALEALIATDYQRVAALLSEVFMLLSHTCSDIEATRLVMNRQCTALVDRWNMEVTSSNQYLEGTIFDAQKQALTYNMLMGRAQNVLGGVGQFFRTGGSDGATATSASLAAYNPLAAVLPYDSTLASPVPIIPGPLPLPAPSPAQPPAQVPPPVPPNDPPRGGFNKN